MVSPSYAAYNDGFAFPGLDLRMLVSKRERSWNVLTILSIPRGPRDCSWLALTKIVHVTCTYRADRVGDSCHASVSAALQRGAPLRTPCGHYVSCPHSLRLLFVLRLLNGLS